MTILPHGTERIALLAGSDGPRLTSLARSMRARYVPALGGYALYPGAMGRLEALYAAGYTCALRAGHWRFGVDGGRLTLDRYEATRRAKQLQATP